jgi:Na+/glutamate symporter
MTKRKRKKNTKTKKKKKKKKQKKKKEKRKKKKKTSVVQETPNVTNIFMVLLLIAGASRRQRIYKER